MTRNNERFYQRWYYAQLLERKRRGDNVYRVFDSSWNTSFNDVNFDYFPHFGVPNLEASRNGVADTNSKTVLGRLGHKLTGVWYFEITMSAFAGGEASAGVGLSTATPAGFVGHDTNSLGYRDDGDVYFNNAVIASLAPYVNGDVIGVLLDFTTGNLSFSVNGVDQGFLWPSLGVSLWYPAASLANQFNVATLATIATHLSFLPVGAQPWS